MKLGLNDLLPKHFSNIVMNESLVLMVITSYRNGVTRNRFSGCAEKR